jgi:hypothetical protein
VQLAVAQEAKGDAEDEVAVEVVEGESISQVYSLAPAMAPLSSAMIAWSGKYSRIALTRRASLAWSASVTTSA